MASSDARSDGAAPDAVVAKLQKQLEYYFSDANLRRDAHLRGLPAHRPWQQVWHRGICGALGYRDRRRLRGRHAVAADACLPGHLHGVSRIRRDRRGQQQHVRDHRLPIITTTPCAHQ